MAYITIKLTEIGEGYVQYQSVAAFITLDKEEYLLDSRLLDNEDYEADRDVIQGFIGAWEAISDIDSTRLEIDEGVLQLEIELSAMIGSEEEADAELKQREQDEADMPGGFFD